MKAGGAEDPQRAAERRQVAAAALLPEVGAVCRIAIAPDADNIGAPAMCFGNDIALTRADQ
jgi:hypothetical protein